MTAGDLVQARYMPDLGTGRVCRIENDGRALVTFPNAPEGPYAEIFHHGELRIVAVTAS
jgi:hypothetical protein